MASPVTSKFKGPIIDPALCRCCRSIKKCRLLTSEYIHNGTKEVYSDMFMDCFGLLLSHLDSNEKEVGVCATCVVRLRDATAFRRQVLQCEEMFLQAKLEDKDDLDSKPLIDVKIEPICTSDADLMDYDDNDHIGSPIPITEQETNNKKSIEIEVLVDKKAEKNSNKLKKKLTRTKKVLINKELILKAQKLKAKLDRMLDDKSQPKNKSLKPTKLKTQINSKTKGNSEPHLQEPDLDNDMMLYLNAVTILLHSYACPFINRISMYYCYRCRDQFTNPSELREHTLTHNPKEMFEILRGNKRIPQFDITRIDCRLCSVKIDDIETFKTHISTVHNKVIYPVSNEFLKFRLTMSDLRCTECNEAFPYFDMLKKHMTEHFGTLICDMCGACFLEQASLRTHLKSHSKIEMLFPCEICGKNLKSKYSKYLHIATVHEKRPTVNCYKCDASFLSYAVRNRHLIEVHGDKRTFPCKLCDKVYNRRKTLMEHNRRNHLKVFKHQCQLCDQKFYLPSRLKEHMATHTGERNFQCEFCDKSYPRLQSLQEHIRSHSNERRFKCNICNTSFTQNGSLKNHIKSHHQGYDIDTGFS